MNLKTITYDSDKWQLVPKEATDKMIKAGLTNYAHCNIDKFYNQLLAAAPQPEELSPWLPIESAPKDGTDILLLIENSSNPMQDELQSVSIGAFNIADDNEWTFAGWHWEQDCYERGDGTPIGWLPLPQPPEVE